MPASFFTHLEELRARLIKVFLAFGIGCIISWNFLDPLIRFMVEPVGRLVFTSPEEAFSARMSLCLLSGFILASPVIIFQIWSFVAGGLTTDEQKYIRIFLPLSLFLFLAGVLFGYYVMVPFSLKFLMSFASAWMVPMITVDKYISFVGTMIFSSGVAFEMPLILAFLARIGIATPEFLRQKRGIAYVLILIVAAVLTPPDVVSQIILAIPLILLYEAGIFLAAVAEKQRKV